MIRKRGKEYHYEFMLKGRRFYGVCENCSTEAEAKKYVKQIRDTAAQASQQKNVKALLENFRQELSGGGAIPLQKAFDLAMEKPRRKKITAQKTIERKQGIWNDFLTFMEEKYPHCDTIDQVRHSHAEEYIAILQRNGRFNKNTYYMRNGKKLPSSSTDTPSNKTINDYIMICKEIFTLLARDAGITDNPFNMPKLQQDSETREAFTQEELSLIFQNWDPFTQPLFTLGISTALREGDICTLKWSDIDFMERVIRKRMNKTRRMVEIPISHELCQYLKTLQENNETEYVLPDHAKMYWENPSGISYRVKQFLEGVGIETTRTPEGRSRAVSVKDLHSCRHTFCYYAGIQGIPLSVVQSIVGHMSPEMTKHYAAHATVEDKRNAINRMDLVHVLAGTDNQPLPIRAEINQLLDAMDQEELQKVLKFLKG